MILTFDLKQSTLLLMMNPVTMFSEVLVRNSEVGSFCKPIPLDGMDRKTDGQSKVKVIAIMLCSHHGLDKNEVPVNIFHSLQNLSLLHHIKQFAKLTGHIKNGS